MDGCRSSCAPPPSRIFFFDVLTGRIVAVVGSRAKGTVGRGLAPSAPRPTHSMPTSLWSVCVLQSGSYIPRSPPAHRDKGTTMAMVLIVDDEEANLYALRLVLESRGYTVFWASCGPEALKLAAE